MKILRRDTLKREYIGWRINLIWKNAEEEIRLKGKVYSEVKDTLKGNDTLEGKNRDKFWKILWNIQQDWIILRKKYMLH